MLQNYLKTGIRNLKRFKGYSFINITGLAVGLAVCILILVWVKDELSFDRFHENVSNICRIVTHEKEGNVTISFPATPPPLAEYLKYNFPEIINATKLRIQNNWLMENNERSFMEDGVAFIEPAFFEIFTFPFVKGDPGTALSNPNSMVITQSMAEKYFGNEDPIGRTIHAEKEHDFVVSGVIRDIPENSHITFNFAVSFDLLEKFYNWKANTWYSNMYRTYVQLKPGASHVNLSNKIAGIVSKKTKNDIFTLELQPLTKIHLHSTHLLQSDALNQGDIKRVRLFTILAILILIMACINFVSLTTARGQYRAREIGMRKVSGANRADIVLQFLGESMLLTIIAFVLAIVLVSLFLPVFNGLSGKNLSLNAILSPSFLSLLIGIIFLTGLMSGGYPAVILSAYQPVKVLKGKSDKGNRGGNFRKILVIVQFSVSVILIISTLIVYRQIDYIRNIDLGYKKDHIITLRVRGDIQDNYETAKLEWLKNPDIINVTASSSLPTMRGAHRGGLNWPGKDPSHKPGMWFYSVDFDFIKTCNMEIIDGRDFSRNRKTDEQNFIINESAARFMGLSEPVGQWFSYMGKNKGTIIGVVKDFHFESIKKSVEPLVLRISPVYRYIIIKARPDNISKTVADIKKVWKAFNPGFPMDYHFLDESFDRIYMAEYRMGTIFKWFTALGILISLLGLVGLASFMAQQRTREIAIRKVLGATQTNAVFLITRNFLILMTISNILAWPVAYICMTRWLQDWAYHTKINITVFLSAAAISVLIILGSVCYHANKAANLNPVDSLKYE